MNEILATARSMLGAMPDRWRILVGTVPADDVRRSPGAGQWSALACLQHLVDTERDVFPVRVRAFLAGRDFAAFDPDAQGTRAVGESDPVALAGDFAQLRAASLELLKGVGEADLDRTARHAALGPVTLREMLHEWVAHDLNHTIQAERALMQPFIVASGRWRGYFVDHDAEAAR